VVLRCGIGCGQIIRRHQLDPNLVKSYATDFCGVKTLREATREQVENFVVHLGDWAEKDSNFQARNWLNGFRRITLVHVCLR
jgi:hypothetical protein